MNVIKVPSKLAYRLKEIGFPQPIKRGWFYKDNTIMYVDKIDTLLTMDCFAPTYYDVWKWLWKKKDTKIEIRSNNQWCINGIVCDCNSSDPEDILIDGINFIFENIIKYE